LPLESDRAGHVVEDNDMFDLRVWHDEIREFTGFVDSAPDGGG
jgi:hypothetical protein